MIKIRTQADPIILRQEATFIAGGGNGYLNNAFSFHQAWGYPNVRRAGTLEEIIQWVSRNIHGVLSRLRIVTHANDTAILTNLLRGYPPRRGTTQEMLEQAMGGLRPVLARYGGHATEQEVVDRALAFLRGNRAHADALQRLGGGRVPEPGSHLHGMVWWTIDRHFVQNVRVSRGQFPRRNEVLRLIDGNIQVFRAALEAEPALQPGDQTVEYALAQRYADLQAVRQGIQTFLGAISWSDISQAEARDLSGQMTRESQPVQRAITRGTFEQDLETLRDLMGLRTMVEIRGCNIGQSLDFLRQFQRFFSGPFRPSVSAPDIFQFFGHPGYWLLSNSDRDLDRAWQDLQLQQSFIDWWNVIHPTLGEPSGDDFKAYLRSGEVFPADSRLVTINALGRDAISDWLARHNYHIAATDAIRQRFLRGPLSGAIARLWIDWLQDRGNNPTEILFPPDPRYSSHIVEVPGELGDFEAPQGSTGYG
jgi:hypothetical protein